MFPHPMIGAAAVCAVRGAQQAVAFPVAHRWRQAAAMPCMHCRAAGAHPKAAPALTSHCGRQKSVELSSGSRWSAAHLQAARSMFGLHSSEAGPGWVGGLAGCVAAHLAAAL